jgi:hypothetical protein
MDRNDIPPGSALLGPSAKVQHPRRTVLVSLAGGGLLVAAAGSQFRAGSAPLGQDDTSPTAAEDEGTPAPFTSQVFAGEGFVGEAKDVSIGDAFVAVVIADAQSGAEAREARAILYGDAENDIKEWFPGAVVGNSLDLASDGGARLHGVFSEEGATGTIAMPDGTFLPFNAEPATGVAGLYTVIFFPDGHVDGTSERGGKLVGLLGEMEEGTDIQPLNGTLTPPDGEPLGFTVKIKSEPPHTPDKPPVNARFVVLNDGRIRGGANRKEGGGNFYDYLID